MSFFVHESSIIDSPCVIKDGVKIWHFSHILRNATINENTTISQGCMIGEGVNIGKNCKIQNNVSIFSGVSLEDDVFIGPSVVFTNVLNPRAFIERKDEFKPTIVKKGASIGANATIVCGVSIGEYALIGAGAVVTKSIPPFCVAVGNPAKIVGRVDKNGNKTT